jgi:hypothetical protein
MYGHKLRIKNLWQISDNQCFPYLTNIIFFNKFISVSLKRLVNKREMIVFLGNHRKIFKMAVTWAWIISSLVLLICDFTIAGMCISVCLRLMKIVIISIFNYIVTTKCIYVYWRGKPRPCVCVRKHLSFLIKYIFLFA